MNLFQLGEFRLHSGLVSDFKIQCEALTDTDLECCAFLLSRRVPPFGSVEGVPTGGNTLALKMMKYATEGPVLIVDDVFTTGGSLMRQRGQRQAHGAVIFARGPVPVWVTALWQMF